MASERQIAANRRNAQKSTGPKTGAGKRRASTNALRHGLASHGLSSGAEFAEEIERVAKEISGSRESPTLHALAQSAAEAIVEIARVRRTRVALIERVQITGNLCKALEVAALQQRRALLRGRNIPTAEDGPPVMAGDVSDSSEAIRLLLPQLLALDRYERRAASRRDRALRTISAMAF